MYRIATDKADPFFGLAIIFDNDLLFGHEVSSTGCTDLVLFLHSIPTDLTAAGPSFITGFQV
jgi:hypothetical protein